MSKTLCPHITKEQYYCKHCSDMKILVYFTNQAYYNKMGQRKIRPKKFYSNIRHDKKGRQHSINEFIKMMNKPKRAGTYEIICFYSNPDEQEIDRYIP